MSILLPVLSLLGCKGNVDLGQGAEADARLTADVYTWECGDSSTGEIYEGAFSWNISLEYAPDGLQDRQLPSGCVAGLSMFPFDAGASGTDIPGLSDEPDWEAGTRSGELLREGAGFYYDEVFTNVHTCEPADELLGGGLELLEAGPFSGAIAPEAGTIADVSVDAGDDDLIDFGETVEVSWDADEWDEVWIQVRQERDGEAWGTVTCNAGSGDSFTVGDDVWELLNSQLDTPYINLYVGFQNSETQEMDDGQKIEVVTRGMHVFVVQS